MLVDEVVMTDEAFSNGHRSPTLQLSQARPLSARLIARHDRQAGIQGGGAPVLRLVEGPAKGGCGRRLLPESVSDRRLIDDLPEGTAGASWTFFVFFGQPGL